ncbi:MarR family winged helix-turn-helix transcriptional regulator [Sediminibacillus albus]|uniref:DNA-binding transcriptional regulator, MarR family n=1 Tax=Sediminibacillus albus TaxID=407036 RepID=A0A1G8WF29_9BACI|nr:MarR family transcriptional regulator [Sediminibacillus albus]SDJ76793.1 DNA-binding transcriptional regulator, MarR family [Sediminibacillus albus]
MAEKTGIEIYELLKEIQQLMKKDLRKEMADNNLTPLQIMIIHLLGEKNRLKVSEISRKMNLANSTISGVLDRLEQQGYIQRKRDDKDKRIVYILLTEKAEALQTSVYGLVHSYLNNMVKGASDEEIEQIIKGLATLKRLLEK